MPFQTERASASADLKHATLFPAFPRPPRTLEPAQMALTSSFVSTTFSGTARTLFLADWTITGVFDWAIRGDSITGEYCLPYNSMLLHHIWKKLQTCSECQVRINIINTPYTPPRSWESHPIKQLGLVIHNVDGVKEHTTVSGNMSQRTGTSVSGNRNVGVREQYVGVREQYVGVREHMRTVHIVRCAACANSAQSA